MQGKPPDDSAPRSLAARQTSSETNPEASAENGAAAAQLASYWRTNLRILVALLSVWFLVSFGCGILFVDELNAVRWPGKGFKLGFWFAQQGSIFTFIALIFVYVFVMNRLDRRYGFNEE